MKLNLRNEENDLKQRNRMFEEVNSYESLDP